MVCIVSLYLWQHEWVKNRRYYKVNKHTDTIEKVFHRKKKLHNSKPTSIMPFSNVGPSSITMNDIQMTHHHKQDSLLQLSSLYGFSPQMIVPWPAAECQQTGQETPADDVDMVMTCGKFVYNRTCEFLKKLLAHYEITTIV